MPTKSLKKTNRIKLSFNDYKYDDLLRAFSLYAREEDELAPFAASLLSERVNDLLNKQDLYKADQQPKYLLH